MGSLRGRVEADDGPGEPLSVPRRCVKLAAIDAVEQLAEAGGGSLAVSLSHRWEPIPWPDVTPAAVLATVIEPDARSPLGRQPARSVPDGAEQTVPAYNLGGEPMGTDESSPVPAVVYAAKSTEDKGGSIPDQITRTRTAAEAEGRTVVDEYSDEAKSAYKGNRGPDLQRAKRLAADLARQHGQAELWVLHSDRLARGGGAAPGDAMHLAEVWFEMRRAGVQLRSVEDDRSLQDLVLVAVMGERNHEDSKRKSAATKAGLRRRTERGEAHGGPPPYGYRWTPNKGGLQVEPGEAAIVERIYRQYLTGGRQQAIAKRLNAERVPTRHGRADWHQATIRGILERPTYRGAVRVHGDDGTETEVEGKHPPIISADLWAEVAALREAQARAPGGGRGRPADGFLLSRGLLRCACGGTMVPRTAKNCRGTTYERYYCYGRKLDPASCDLPPLPRALVDDTITEYFVSAVLDVEETRRRAAAAADHAISEVAALRESAERQARTATEAVERVGRDYLSGDLSASRYETLIAQAESERDAAETEAERLRDRERSVRELPDLPDALEDLHRRLIEPVRDADTIVSLRAGLARVFERFEVVRVPLDGASDTEIRYPWPMRDDVQLNPDDDAADALAPQLKVDGRRRVGSDRPAGRPSSEPERVDLNADPFAPAKPLTAAERRDLARSAQERPAEVLALVPIPRPEVVLGSGSESRLRILPAALDQASADRDDERGNGFVT